MITYQQALKELRKENSQKIKFLEKHQNLFPVANEYAEKFSDSHDYHFGKRNSRVSFAADSGSIRALGLFFELGKDDTFNDVLPLIDEMIRDPRLEMTKPLDRKIESKHDPIGCVFKERTSDNGASLRVRIFISSSTKCKQVGTGKYKEIMEVVCE